MPHAIIELGSLNLKDRTTHKNLVQFVADHKTNIAYVMRTKRTYTQQKRTRRNMKL